MMAIYCKEQVALTSFRWMPCGRPAKYKATKDISNSNSSLKSIVCVCGIHKKRYEKRDYAIEVLK